MDHTLAYSVIIRYLPEEKSEWKYLVIIPDFSGITQGNSIPNAIAMARDYMGTYSLEEEMPIPGSKELQTETDDIVTLVDINPDKYKKAMDETPVKKTLTIPRYLNDLGIDAGINFSQTLTEALRKKLCA